MTSLASRIQAANTTVFVDGDLDAIEDIFDPDYVVHLTDRDLSGGHGGIRKAIGMTRRAFPNVQVDVEVFLEDDDKVSWRRTFRGVQEGSYLGFPASGREIVWSDMVTSRFREGRIIEEWLVSDLAERLLLARKG